VTTSNASNRLIIELADGARIINTMGGAGRYGPSGFLVPWGAQLIGGPSWYFGQPDTPVSLRGYGGGLNPANRATIVPPYADNNLTS